MSEDPRAERLVRDWLDDSPHPWAADRVVDVVLESMLSIRQDSANPRVVAIRRLGRAALAAAAVLALGAVSVLVLGRPQQTVVPGEAPSPSSLPSPTLAPVTGLPGRFVFVTHRSGNADIYTMNPDRSDLRQLTDDRAGDYLPSWSPDSSMVVFTSDRTGSQDIWIMNADGSEQTQVTDFRGDWAWARWSPDGSQLVVESSERAVDSLYLVGMDGREPRLLFEPGDHGLRIAAGPFWAPGDRIGFTGSGGAFGDPYDLYTVAADGTDLRKLTSTVEGGTGSWSPDRRWIAFHTDQDGDCIHRINADGTGLVSLTEGSGLFNLTGECNREFTTSWSPDSTRIGWAGGAYGPDNIHVMDADGSNHVVLTSTGDIRDLSWGIAP